MSHSVKKSLRQNTRIDYKLLNQPGEKMHKGSDESQSANSAANMDMKEISNQSSCVLDKEHLFKYQLLKEEIDDFIDENPANHNIIITDIDKCIDEITRLRSQFRTICLEIQHSDAYEMSYSEEVNSILACIKEYIINAKQRKNELRGEEKQAHQVETTIKLQKSIEETAQKSRSAEFLISEVSRLTDELRLEFCKETDGEVCDDEVLRRKEDLPSTVDKMKELSSKFQQCLETIPEEYENKDKIITNLKENYELLLTDKENYEKFVNTELRERELEKEKSFQVTSINIKLSKFSGYESDLDIYSFQCEFEKLHLKSTPKKY